jgi:hypothetical protein
MKCTSLLLLLLTLLTVPSHAENEKNPCLGAMKDLAIQQQYFGANKMPSELECGAISRAIGNCKENILPAYYKINSLNTLFVYKDPSSKEITKYVFEKPESECQSSDKCNRFRLEFSDPKIASGKCTFGRVDRVTITPEKTEKNRFTFYTEELCADFNRSRLSLKIDGLTYVRQTPNWVKKFSLNLKSDEPLAEVNRFYKNCQQFCRDCKPNGNNPLSKEAQATGNGAH